MPAKKADTRFVGKKGEDYAVELLKEKGYKIIQRNFYTKVGEIDIIAQDGEVLVFVEVKLRKNMKYGVPEEAVTNRKLHHIKRAGQYFCLENNIKNIKMRIDVVSLLLSNGELVRKKLIKVQSV